jgi:hypothetical protein
MVRNRLQIADQAQAGGILAPIPKIEVKECMEKAPLNKRRNSPSRTYAGLEHLTR